MNEIFPSIFELFPSKPTPKKFRTFFIRRNEGNLLIPCFSTNSTIEAHFDAIVQYGGLRKQLLGDSHFRSPHCDEVASRFDAPLFCSEVEAPEVISVLKNVEVFPFERHHMEAGVEVIPTPGHREGGVCYLIEVVNKRFLFVGDFIWHDGEKWLMTATKKGMRAYSASLDLLETLEFDVIICNAMISNPTCYIEVDPATRASFIASLRNQMTKN
jgi:hydroxyacylglutathione hydrolase